MQKGIFIIAFILIASNARSQLCTNPGQTPASAVLVCGTTAFTQHPGQFCGQINVPTPCPPGFNYTNINPHFFRMACYSSGTLGFLIVPDDPTANFDWQLFDITSTNPQDIFTNPNLFVACNWSSEPGETGATTDGNNLTECNGPGVPVYSKMPNIQFGHTYMLMVCNQTGTNTPYQISFTGGSASITDAIEPKLLKARLSCDGTKVIVRLNKDVKCVTLARDGSDFTISGGASIIGADPNDCSILESSDSLTLFLNQPLPNGNYILRMVTGNDGNTLLDLCNRAIGVNDSLLLIAAPPLPTPMDSIYPVACGPGFIQLVFQKPMRCNSIANDGSDFILTGPQNVSLTPTLTCDANGLSSIIRLVFSTPLVTGGVYQVRLTTGSDGNTIVDECGIPSLDGSTINFTIKDTVSAKFNYNILPSCKENTVAFQHNGGNQINSWQWDVGIPVTNIPAPIANYPGAVDTDISLTVTNGFCTDTWSQHLKFDNRLEVSFEMPSIVCPGDSVTIKNTTTGNIDFWDWNFGNGQINSTSSPGILYFPASSTDQVYNIRLIAGNSVLNCMDTAIRTLRIPVTCNISIPSAFTPNRDGRNDFFYPINAHSLAAFEFRIYDRSGNLIFLSRDPSKKWDGTYKGLLQPTGIFVWTLTYNLPSVKEKISQKGTVMLIR